MKSDFKIIEDKKLITEILSSDITTEKYIKLKHEEFHHEKFNRHYNLISDFRKCDKKLKKKDLQDMIDIFKENKGKINRSKSALILSDINFLKGINLKSGDVDNSHEIQYFTNIEEAENWILS